MTEIIGTLDPALMAREIEIGMSPHGSKTKPGTWANWETTVGHLCGVLADHKEGIKDGNCYLGGSVIDGERRANAIPHMDLCVLDLDTGENIADLIKAIQAQGWFALIYTTHSHMKPITEIKKDAVINWIGGDVVNPDIDHVKGYLAEVKRYQPQILADAELLETKHTAEGIKLIVKHAPMPKFRIVMILKERFVVATRAAKQSDAINEWKERYAGISKKLGAFFDRSCVDPSRLFYTPRHPPGTDLHRVYVLAGEPIDLDSIPRVSQREAKQGIVDPFAKAAIKLGHASGGDYATPGILKFLLDHGELFEFETCLMEMEPDGDRAQRNAGGRTHECPNDAAHSDAGNPEDKGFFCVNGTDSEHGFVAHCSHDSCASLDRANYLDLICQRHTLTTKDLMRWVPETIEDVKPVEKPAEPQPEKKVSEAPTEQHAEPQASTGDLMQDIASMTPDDAVAAIHGAAVSPTVYGMLKKQWQKNTGLGAKVFEAVVKNIDREAKKNEKPKREREKDDTLPDGMMIQDGKIYFTAYEGEVGNKTAVPGTFICESFQPLGLVDDTQGERIGVRIRAKDKEITVNMSDIYAGKSELAMHLTSVAKLVCGSDRKATDGLSNIFVNFLIMKTGRVLIEATKPGWIADDCFILANGDVVGNHPAQISLSDKSGYKSWQEGRPSTNGDEEKERGIYEAVWDHGPLLWRYTDLLGLAAPCQAIVNCRSGGHTLDGFTRGGKSTSQIVQVARAGSPDLGSKYGGGFIRCTDTPESMEIPFSNASGSPMALDELALMRDPSQLSRYLFNLAGESGKIRMGRDAVTQRKTHEWKTIMTISTEKSVVDIISQAGKTMVAGLISRFPPISIVGLCEMSEENGRLANQIKETLIKNNGHSMAKFVKDALIGIDRTDAIKEWNSLKEHLAGDDVHLFEPSVFFALAWFAGRQAVRIGLTKGMTYEKVEECVRAAWNSFKMSGVAGNLVPGEAEVDRLYKFILDKWDRQILEVSKDGDDHPGMERFGYYYGETPTKDDGIHDPIPAIPAGIALDTEVFDKATGGSGNRLATLKLMEKKGMLIKPEEGYYHKYLKGKGFYKHYLLNFDMFAPEPQKGPGAENNAGQDPQKDVKENLSQQMKGDSRAHRSEKEPDGSRTLQEPVVQEAH